MNNIDLNKIVLYNFKKNKVLIISLTLTFCAYILFHIVFPKSAAKMLDNIDNLSINLILIAVIPFVVSQIIFYIADKLYTTSINKFESDIITELLQIVLKSQVDNNLEIKKNVMANNLMKIFEIKQIIHLLSAYFIPAIFISIALFIFFIKINNTLALSTLLIILSGGILMIYYTKKCVKKSMLRDKKHDIFRDEINDIITNIEKIIISNTIDHEVDRIKLIKQELQKYYISSEHTNTNMKGVISIISIIILFVVGIQLYKLYKVNKVTKGDFIAYMYILLALINYYDSASYEINNLFYYIGNYNQTKKYFKQFNITHNNKLNDFIIDDGKIVIQNLSMNFDNKSIFKNYNITFSPALKYALIGKIGSGKSTLLRLILNLHDYSGNILIDNQNIKNFSNDQLRRSIGYLPQQIFFFNRSIEDNILYGLHTKTKSDLHNIINIYGLVQFINRFPLGLSTIVQKNGENLSGGQKQIIYLIKIILEDKKIILMDEPTSALDEFHKRIFINILSKINNKTIIIVTHDKEIYPYLDKIIEITKK